PRPGDALHVRHRRIAVEIGVVIAVLLDDAEDARWRRTAGHAGGDRPLRHAHAIAKEHHLLIADRNDDLQWTFRHLAKTHILLLGPGLFPFRGRGPHYEPGGPASLPEGRPSHRPSRKARPCRARRLNSTMRQGSPMPLPRSARCAAPQAERTPA